ncbi:RNA binding domain-containing protein [Capsaspora owczarzaki ATCC 30864]|uniref:RNA binding domain-containing protein n=1 Tax=Capsaspora owczarzaki (strain ATCC 30864) TaxID=595528 RepID=A0A0D2VYE6_CAPO3|nr:RNA binding domain-containing protein [Capsaspora owczarzaki ATCC 30864]KJE96742.1 RNA binding domain-containing protein [Capsaspora owczarzaki ATCC 30864]|eukprot:XP_004343740.1 RNA binding domain-containing protein [Capsaspora owczarzaki ATCC 30864]
MADIEVESSAMEQDEYDSLPTTSDDNGREGGPQRSTEGWVVMVTGLHEEAAKDAINDKFSEAGHVRKVVLEYDRRTGFNKGYALIEYNEMSEAQTAIEELNGTSYLDQTIGVDWAFVRPPAGARSSRRGGRGDRE